MNSWGKNCFLHDLPKITNGDVSITITEATHRSSVTTAVVTAPVAVVAASAAVPIDFNWSSNAENPEGGGWGWSLFSGGEDEDELPEITEAPAKEEKKGPLKALGVSVGVDKREAQLKKEVR